MQHNRLRFRPDFQNSKQGYYPQRDTHVSIADLCQIVSDRLFRGIYSPAELGPLTLLCADMFSCSRTHLWRAIPVLLRGGKTKSYHDPVCQRPSQEVYKGPPGRYVRACFAGHAMQAYQESMRFKNFAIGSLERLDDNEVSS